LIRLIAGLIVAALVIVGIGSLLMRGPASSPKIDSTPEPISAVAPPPAPSPIVESIRPLAGVDTGGKCINPPMNTICVR
jgi:hypothetical protein